MPAPGGSYNPNGRFHIVRSYVAQFVFNGLPVVTQADNVFTLVNPGDPGHTYVCVIDPRFWEWSSNNWTLDYVISESYFLTAPSPVHNVMTFTLSYYFHGTTGLPSIGFQPFGLAFPDYYIYPFPPAPPDYWMPPFGV